MIYPILTTKLQLDNLYKELPSGFNINSYKQIRKLLGINKSDCQSLYNLALSDNINSHKALVILKIKKALII